MFFLNTVTFPPFIWRNWLCFLVCSHQKSPHISSSSGTWTAGNSKHFWTNYVKKNQYAIWIHYLDAWINMFYLDQQCCQITGELGDRGLTAPGIWGLWGSGAGSAQAQCCSWLPLLLAALMLWQRGKQNSFWQTGRMQQGQMRHLWTVWEWMFSADHELTFLGEK